MHLLSINGLLNLLSALGLLNEKTLCKWHLIIVIARERLAQKQQLSGNLGNKGLEHAANICYCLKLTT